MHRLMLLAPLLVLVPGRAAGQLPPKAPTFDRTVAPLLASRCLDCHGAASPRGGLDLTRRKSALAGGKSGAVIVPGKPAESLLWEHVERGRMPPKAPLSAAEKKVLHDWIKAGAPWGTDPIDPFRITTDRRAGYDWWALQPLGQPQQPRVKDAAWVRNPIDAFVLQRLEARGLRPSPPADRRTLIRRLTFDLLGLPPGPEDIDAFLKDDSADAYEKLVDRLLNSPHYGERWARHWLDVARFGESDGFEYDKRRPNAWRYRDWVVAALNADMPYDEFVRLQLAGDVLRPGDAAAVTATGFLVAGPWDEVGQRQQSAVMRAVVRQDELEDILGVVGQTFLGLTVHCARCHDHKFDPIRQAEYYQLAAALAGVKHGERPIATPEVQKRRAILVARGDELRRLVRGVDGEVTRAILAERAQGQPPRPEPPRPVARWVFNADLRDQLGALHGTAQGGAALKGGRLRLDGRRALVATAPLQRDLKARTLEAWVSLADLAQRGGGAISVQTLDGVTFDAIVFGEREPGRWLAGSNGFTRTRNFDGPAETEASKRLVHVAIAYHEDGTIAGYRDGKPYGRPYRSSGPVVFKAGKAQVVFGVRHGLPGGNKMLAGSIARAQLYDRALTPAEVAASAGRVDHVEPAEILARLSPERRAERQGWAAELANVEKELAGLDNLKAYAVTPQEPEKVHLLLRGEPGRPGPEVTPRGIAAVHGLAPDFPLSPGAPEGERRKALARWVTDPGNPLFARVIVNRLWHHHFGVGLVDTPSDFGFNGGRPSHPELLDHLAGELLRRKGSLKAMHRLVVTSAAYRQSSRWSAAAAKIDADNRLLWRKSPARLEAEAVRDTLLAVAGQLNRDGGGPGYEDFLVTVFGVTQSFKNVDRPGPEYQRRSLYRTWARSGRNNLLDAFDCPDPSTNTPRRAMTTTPAQALSLLNNALVLRMADAFADRLRREAGQNAARQVERAYLLAYGRPAVGEEAAAARQFIDRHGLPAFCRVVFNSNEFLYID